jgi:choline dehydrogenase-like flavoprotein
MIDDLRRLEDGAELQADVCVIGAGAAGIAIAHELLGGRADVVVLESGGRRRSAATERLNEGEASGLSDTALTEGRGRLLGGTTALWAGQCLPLDASTPARRPWVPASGWPFGHEELEPFYRRAEALLQIEGEVYDERVWDGFGIERPQVDPSRFVHRFTVWCPETHLGRLYRGRLAASGNVRVLLHATATEIVTSPSGERFASVRAATPEGKRVRVHAKACVLSAGAVENARLLLASSGVHAAGVGNGHDVVGRYFQDHPNGHVATIAGEGLARLQQLYGLLRRGRLRYLPRLSLSPGLERSQEVLACSAYPVFHVADHAAMEAARRLQRAAKARRRPAALRRDLAQAARATGPLAAAIGRRLARDRSAEPPPAHVTLQLHAEQAPNPDSRVTLSRRRDRLGVPLPSVDWRLTELDHRTARTMVREVADELARLGLGQVRPEPWLEREGWARRMDDSWHQMGTTRMGTDERCSVVDADCRVHGVDGLFVAGASVFPTAGAANPTLTIVALAARLADHLSAELERPAALRLSAC